MTVLPRGPEPADSQTTPSDLKPIIALARAGQRAEASAQLRAFLAASPSSVDGWWLAARLATDRTEAELAARRVLALAPDHPYAGRLLDTPPGAAAPSPTMPPSTAPVAAALAAKERAAIRGRNQPRHVGSRRIILVALLIFALVMGLGVLAVTGRDFGLIGRASSLRAILPIGSRSPSLRFGILFPGATHDYTFTGQKESAVLVTLMFPVGSGSPAKAIKFFGPDGSLLTYGANSGANTTSLSYILPTDGMYRIQITGTADKAQGLYLLQAIAASTAVDSAR
jgi:hypothetical protein